MTIDGGVLLLRDVAGRRPSVDRTSVGRNQTNGHQTSLYWTNNAHGADAGSVMKSSLDGGMATSLASGQDSPVNIAVDSTHVYFVTHGALMSVSLDGGGPTILASGPGPYDVAVDSTNVYWTDYAAGAVMSVPLGGGSPLTLASGQAGANGIALDSSTVYWTTFTGGTVMKVAKP